MVKKIRISGPVQCHVKPPGSKSITNRALVCAALSDYNTCLTGALDSEDTQVMLDALRTLGLYIEHNPEEATIYVKGCGGDFPNKNAEIHVANSGTTARFLTAALAVTEGCNYRIYGKPRMHERPIGDLISALWQLGADVRSEMGNDCPPVLIGKNGKFGGNAQVSGEISSQFLSALLLAAPVSPSDIILSVQGELVSKPYIQMTLEVMRAFGATVDAADDFSRFRIAANSQYARKQGGTFCYAVEPDASAASYFFAAAAVTGGTVTVEGLSQNSLQGDINFCCCLEQMGCRVQFDANSTTVTTPTNALQGITVDMNAISDTVMTLGIVALFAKGPTRITNVAHIRHKETDRISALACELRKFGATVTEFDDGLEIIPPITFPDNEIEINTYDDHRMAMSFAIAGLKVPDVVIRDPGCVAKTYPGFFDDLEKYAKRH
ncbi:MAG: 3-phosphoshikimate 1-carboxyvinyltransferase [Planctomycetaceae bacterium]|nr:3-phosphoshikimate 1-carboxyvinyltransferase [Planctomycetaceae bacterium]